MPGDLTCTTDGATIVRWFFGSQEFPPEFITAAVLAQMFLISRTISLDTPTNPSNQPISAPVCSQSCALFQASESTSGLSVLFGSSRECQNPTSESRPRTQRIINLRPRKHGGWKMMEIENERSDLLPWAPTVSDKEPVQCAAHSPHISTIRPLHCLAGEW